MIRDEIVETKYSTHHTVPLYRLRSHSFQALTTFISYCFKRQQQMDLYQIQVSFYKNSLKDTIFLGYLNYSKEHTLILFIRSNYQWIYF